MFRYADPDACPGCRHSIDRTSPTCVQCGLVLTGPRPREIFLALAHADRLVAELYVAPATPVPTPAPAAPTAPTAPAHPSYHPMGGKAPRSGLSASSVPRILLGLGALCLLVASLVFLAVAWSALGVGGRTLVLMGFTAAAATLLWWMAGRGLRAAAEAFGAVGLGLLALDLGGARGAGWLGSIDDGWFVLVSGLLVALAAAGTAVWASGTVVRRLFAAEVFAAVAVAFAAVGAYQVVTDDAAVQLLAALALSGGCALLARRVGLREVALGCWAWAGLAWLGLVVVAVSRLSPQTVEHVWVDLAVWPTLVAAGLAGSVAVTRRLAVGYRVSAAAVGLVLGTLALTVVSFDESATTVSLVQVAVVAAGALLVAVLPKPWGWAACAPSGMAATALAASAVRLAVEALEALAPAEVWGYDLTDRIGGPDIAWSWPLLLPVGVLAVSTFVASVLGCAARPIRPVAVPTAVSLLVAAALLPALYDAALGVAVLSLVLATALVVMAAASTDQWQLWLASVVPGLLALLGGLGDDVATAVVLVVPVVAAVAAERSRNEIIRIGGRAVAPLAAGGLLWTLGHLAGLPVPWQALPVLLVLGTVVVLRPAWERELAAALAMATAVTGSVASGLQVDQTWLAVHLTVAGVVCTVSSFVNPGRRRLAWLGLALFTSAQWVRLDQVGVDTVEAYTLPLALVLLVVGAVALKRGADSSLRALGAGLSLALVPTLLQVLVEPVGLRAALLGLGCLALVAIGVALRLGAPLVAGAAVGAVVVLREGTLAQVLPQWALIGLVGVALTVVGITWEQRLQELRRVSAYVQGLR